MKYWYGVDLDGTLAKYDGWKGVEHIGDPIPEMLDRVRTWLQQGQAVRIFTARVAGADAELARGHIERWCKKHLGCVLPITNRKDQGMVELWDDRCMQVIPNTGRRVDLDRVALDAAASDLERQFANTSAAGPQLSRAILGMLSAIRGETG